MSASDSDSALHLRFQVWGKVQGVFMRAHTVEKAKQLNLKGWVRNLRDTSIEGEAIGTKENIGQFKHWLATTGAPQCSIEKTEFRVRPNEEVKAKFNSFEKIKGIHNKEDALPALPQA